MRGGETRRKVSATAIAVEGWVGGVLWWKRPGRRTRMNDVGGRGRAVVYTHVYTGVERSGSKERKEGEEHRRRLYRDRQHHFVHTGSDGQ